jgi:hypothetical protein
MYEIRSNRHFVICTLGISILITLVSRSAATCTSPVVTVTVTPTNCALPNVTQEVYVDKSGSDSAGDGTVLNPFFTISHGVSIITDSSPSKKYIVKVGPGDYSDNFALPANVVIKGAEVTVTRITGNVNLNHSSWNDGGQDDRSGYEDLIAVGAQTFDFTAQSSSAGKLYFTNVRFLSTPVMTAYGSFSINQVIFQLCQLFVGHVQNGVEVQSLGSWYDNGDSIYINSNVGNNAAFIAAGGALDGDLIINYTSPGNPITIDLSGFAIQGDLTASGSNIAITSTLGSLIGGTVTLTGGATWTYLGVESSTTVGASGSADEPPEKPLGYLGVQLVDAGTLKQVKIAYYNP